MEINTIYYELTASAFDWAIADDKMVKAWGFNHQLPGPVLRAKKGDRLVIKVKNELDEPTVIHCNVTQSGLNILRREGTHRF